jgi:hypothetical protein
MARAGRAWTQDLRFGQAALATPKPTKQTNPEPNEQETIEQTKNVNNFLFEGWRLASAILEQICFLFCFVFPIVFAHVALTPVGFAGFGCPRQEPWAQGPGVRGGGTARSTEHGPRSRGPGKPKLAKPTHPGPKEHEPLEKHKILIFVKPGESDCLSFEKCVFCYFLFQRIFAHLALRTIGFDGFRLPGAGSRAPTFCCQTFVSVVIRW